MSFHDYRPLIKMMEMYLFFFAYINSFKDIHILIRKCVVKMYSWDLFPHLSKIITKNPKNPVWNFENKSSLYVQLHVQYRNTFQIFFFLMWCLICNRKIKFTRKLGWLFLSTLGRNIYISHGDIMIA